MADTKKSGMLFRYITNRKMKLMIKKMFRLSGIVCVSAVLLASCSSGKKASETTKAPERSDLKGDWVLDQISYDGLSAGERLRFSLLDEGSEDCLKGSTWHLPNNGNGSYTINSNGAGCTPGQKNIVWSYREENKQPVFQYKRVISGVKPKDVADGYKFRIISASDAGLTLQSEITYQGNPIRINYSFSKAN